VKPLGLVFLASVLLLAEPDFGAATVLFASGFGLLFLAGARLRYVIAMMLLAATGFAALAVSSSYRVRRLTAFLDPWADPYNSGFQLTQSLIAIGRGQGFGVGLGDSVQKLFYLPEAHTDFILAVIGEELGIAGVCGVLFLYGMIAYAGLRAAKAAAQRYAQLVAVGMTCLILAQATLNVFAVLGLAPLTGVPLPFVSYGSTNLIVLLAAMGILLNVAAGGGRQLRLVPTERRRPAGAHARHAPRWTSL